MLPASSVKLGDLTLAGHCRPAGAVGGDSYDFLPLSAGRLAFWLADVSGKGLPAALMMAALQAMLRSALARDPSNLPSVLAAANRQFFASVELQHYATLFLGLYDGVARSLRYVSCGHPPALVAHPDGRVSRLESTAPAFGMFETLEAETGEKVLEAQDLFLVASDGVHEAVTPDGQELGETTLIDLALGMRQTPVEETPRALITSIVDEHHYRQTDDMTAVVARLRAPPS